MGRKNKEVIVPTTPVAPPKPPTKEELAKEAKEQAALEALVAKETAKQAALAKEKARQEAKECLLKFFADKDYFAGGPIPDTELLSTKNLDFMTTVEWGSGYELALTKLKIGGKLIGDDPKTDKVVRDGVNKCLEIINECKKLDISSNYAVGIMNLYLQYCEGLK
jgi:hypothetical protein